MGKSKAKTENLAQITARVRATSPGMSQAQATRAAFEEARRQAADRNRSYVDSLDEGRCGGC